MEFHELLLKRRSVREYKRDRKISQEDIRNILLSVIEAPSWKNSQTGRYHCITSSNLTEKIREKCLPEFNRKRSEGAALIVTSFQKNVSGFNSDGDAVNEVGNGWGFYDLGLQNENFILKAKDMGFDTLIMGIRDEKELRKILNIPDGEIIVSVIAVGYGEEQPVCPKHKSVDEIANFY